MDIAKAELIWPGSFLDHQDAGEARSAEALLRALDTAFAEALLALPCFDMACAQLVAGGAAVDWAREQAERRVAEETLRRPRPDLASVADRNALAPAMDWKIPLNRGAVLGFGVCLALLTEGRGHLDTLRPSRCSDRGGCQIRTCAFPGVRSQGE